jgi:hypothetical protein
MLASLPLKEIRTMHRWKKRSVIFSVIVALVLTSTGFPALAGDVQPIEEGSAPAMIADFLLARPLGIVATAVGTVVFVASLPFSAPAGNTKEAFKKLVVDPAKFTFCRPLGRLKRGADAVPKKSE